MSLAVIVALIGYSAFAAFATTGTPAAAAPQNYPKGTVCGDAQLGPWTARQFVGNSTFQGYYSVFTVNTLVLSGGNSGTVSSNSGTLQVYSKAGGNLLFLADYQLMTGSYIISEGYMHLNNFHAKHIDVYMNHLNHPAKDKRVEVGSYSHVTVPNQKISCSVTDGLVGYTP